MNILAQKRMNIYKYNYIHVFYTKIISNILIKAKRSSFTLVITWLPARMGECNLH